MTYVYTQPVNPKCVDGIKNQDETDTDCGGVCDACQTCFDNILNQDETEIDCGGVCGQCQIAFVPVSLPALNEIDCTPVNSAVQMNILDCKDYVLSVG
eukprot:Awhi_evm1s9864